MSKINVVMLEGSAQGEGVYALADRSWRVELCLPLHAVSNATLEIDGDNGE